MTQKKNQTKALEVDKTQISAGVAALLKYVEKSDENKNFLDEPETIQLQLCMKQVPSVKNKIIKCRLPHSLLLPTSEVCLFTRDLDKKNRDFAPTERHFQELLDKNQIKSVTKIIPLKAVKLEYQPFEAKRNLSNMFDVYLADSHIVRLLPGFLGKHFYSRKKYPLQVDLDAVKLPKEIDTALHVSQCILAGRGSSCQVKVGHSGMSAEHICENIVSAVTKVVASLPGGTDNVRNLHIKTGESPGIPLYMSIGGEADVKLPLSRKRRVEAVTEDVDTVMDAKVRILADGRIRLVKDGEDVEDEEVTRRKMYRANRKKAKVKAAKRAASRARKPKQAGGKTAAGDKTAAGGKTAAGISKHAIKGGVKKNKAKNTGLSGGKPANSLKQPATGKAAKIGGKPKPTAKAKVNK